MRTLLIIVLSFGLLNGSLAFGQARTNADCLSDSPDYPDCLGGPYPSKAEKAAAAARAAAEAAGAAAEAAGAAAEAAGAAAEAAGAAAEAADAAAQAAEPEAFES